MACELFPLFLVCFSLGSLSNSSVKVTKNVSFCHKGSFLLANAELFNAVAQLPKAESEQFGGFGFVPAGLF